MISFACISVTFMNLIYIFQKLDFIPIWFAGIDGGIGRMYDSYLMIVESIIVTAVNKMSFVTGMESVLYMVHLVLFCSVQPNQ